MKFLTLPKALYLNPNISKILYDQQSCILFKKLNENLLQRKKICTSHSFIYVIKGCVEIKTPQGEVISVNAGELLFMPRDCYLISDFLTKDKSIEMYLIFIAHDIVSSFIAQKIQQESSSLSNSVVCKIEPNQSVKQYFATIKPVYTNIENNRDLLKLKILEFLHLIYASNKSEIMTALSTSEYNKRHRSLSSLMLENFDKNLNIADFASLSGRSLSTFNRDFKRRFGKPPKQWLIEARMQKAAQLLADDCSVGDCAIAVGYMNVSHFIKSYKSIHGKKPSEMKKSNL